MPNAATTIGTFPLLATLLHSWGIFENISTDVDLSDLPTITASESGTFLTPWTGRDYTNGSACLPYNGTVRYKDGICSETMPRIKDSIFEDAMLRSNTCSRMWKSSCILSVEIGLALPAVFLHTPQKGFHMVLYPEDTEQTVNNTIIKKIYIKDPVTNTRIHSPNNYFFAPNKRLVRYIDVNTKDYEEELLEEENSFCISLLYRSFDDECWKKGKGSSRRSQ